MALQLNFTTCVVNGCTQIKFTETTGTYSLSNLTGWGSPNAELASATSATLTITDPSDNEYIINLFTESFPSGDATFSYTIPVADIADTIVDGKWSFIYTVVANSVTYTKTKYSLFLCNSECCVSQMLASIDSTCDCCNSDTDINDYLKASTFLQSLKNAAKCGDTTNFTAIKKIVDKLCKNKDCKTCK